MTVKLNDYITQDNPSFWVFNGQNGSAYTSSSVNKIIHAACMRAGIKTKVTEHTLRHSFATHLMNQGSSMRNIQQLLGHSDLKTTMIYTEVNNRNLKETQNPMDSCCQRDLTGLTNKEI
jgi:site-specific recombinase XerD